MSNLAGINDESMSFKMTSLIRLEGDLYNNLNSEKSIEAIYIHLFFIAKFIRS